MAAAASPVQALAALLMVAVAAACGPPTRPSAVQQDIGRVESQPAEPGRTLVLSTRVEVTSLSPAPFWQRRFTFLSTPRLFNANLTLLDQRGGVHPYLAEALPQLNSDSWRVFPDGRMETTYRLRPNLVWHDGSPLAAEDFVFAWRLLATPDLGAAASQPQSLMEEVTAPDQRTLVIGWRQLYPDAGTLTEAFQPSPRHILEQPFQQGQTEAFLGLPYWTRDYVGLGPYRLDRWEPGAFVEGAAFAAHALGRPKIDRVKLVFIGDPNTVLANLLSESVHIAIESSIRYQQGLVLQREWGPRNAGVVLLWPSIWRSIQVQLRPNLANPRVLTDLRVRKALAHSLDRQAMNDAVLDGQGAIVDTLIPPLMDYYPEVQRAVATYPYDLRRAEQLLNEVGYARAADGVFTRAGERFTTDLRVLTGTQQEVELAILGSQWRQFGLEMHEGVIPAVQAQDAQLQATLPGLFAGGAASGQRALPNFQSSGIPRPENRWTGRNFGGWSNSEYDRLAETFLTTLPQAQRVQQIIQMAKILSEELPTISYYFSPDGVAHVAALRGPQIVVPDVPTTWNIHQWEFR